MLVFHLEAVYSRQQAVARTKASSEGLDDGALGGTQDSQ